ncbi:MAG: GldG family protein [Chitinispirillaceae bacterium]|nr:GldG family protein [Chitinispirillaceae bacterium]
METKKIKSRTELIVYILIIIGLIAVVNYLATMSFGRIDLTEGKAYSISKATKKILKGLDDVINIKVYFSANLPPNLHRTVTDVKDMLSEYKAYGGKKLRVSWVDPAESENLKSEARSMGIPEIQLQTFEKDKAQVMNGYMGIAVLFADKKEVLPVVQNLQNLEYDLTLAIMKVSRTETPKVGIVKVDTMVDYPPQVMRQMPEDAKKERTDEKFKPLFESLRQNYDVVTIDAFKGEPIDSTIRTIVVPGSFSFTDRALFEIDQYFMKGGNLVVLADAMRVDFHPQYGPQAVNVDSKLLELVKFYGAKVEQSMLLDASCGQVQVPQKVGPFSMNVAMPYPYFVRLGAESFFKDNPAVAPLSDVILPWPNPITLLVDLVTPEKSGAKDTAASTASVQSGVKAVVLAKTSPKSWTVSGYIDLNPQQQWQPAADKLMPHPVAVHLNGSFKSFFAGKSVPPLKQEVLGDSLSKIDLANDLHANRAVAESNSAGQLVVVSNAGFVSSQNAAPQNIMMIQNLVDWFSQDANLIAVRTRAVKDRTIDADLLKKGSSKPGVIRFINIIAMPLIVIFIGIVIFIRRREKVPVVPAAPIITAPAGARGEEKNA